MGTLGITLPKSMCKTCINNTGQQRDTGECVGCGSTGRHYLSDNEIGITRGETLGEDQRRVEEILEQERDLEEKDLER